MPSVIPTDYENLLTSRYDNLSTDTSIDFIFFLIAKRILQSCLKNKSQLSNL